MTDTKPNTTTDTKPDPMTTYVAKLEAALKPFATHSEEYPAHADWHYPATQANRLLIGSFWKARDALNEKPKPTPLPAPETKLISEEALENAIQAMSETARSWEQRCHSIMAALGTDFGGFEENVPDVGSYYQIHLARLTKERDDLQDKVWSMESLAKQTEDSTPEPGPGIAPPQMVRDALALARNRLQVCALDHPMNTLMQIERSGWAQEATAILQRTEQTTEQNTSIARLLNLWLEENEDDLDMNAVAQLHSIIAGQSPYQEPAPVLPTNTNITPMTEDQIMTALKATSCNGLMLRIVRAVEDFHGIKAPTPTEGT